MISFNPLKKNLKKRKLTPYRLIQNGIITSVESTRISYDHNFTLSFINRLCKALDCQPGDIIEYIPDDNPSTHESNLFR